MFTVAVHALVQIDHPSFASPHRTDSLNHHTVPFQFAVWSTQHDVHVTGLTSQRRDEQHHLTLRGCNVMRRTKQALIAQQTMRWDEMGRGDEMR